MKKLHLFTYLALFVGISITNAQYSDILNFTGSSNGATPYANVVISGSTMYGMTSAGGANGVGCIFSVGTNGSGYTDLHDFQLMIGKTPHGSLILSGSTLYGMTELGGTNSDGVIFSIATNGSSYTVLHNFNGTAGKNPMGSLILSGSTLYGLATAGGANSDGCAFSITTSGSSYTDIHDFNGTAGSSPEGSLLLSGSTLYGMTLTGGANSDGVIFSMTTSGGSYTDLHDFNGTAGKGPHGSLILSGSTLYGLATTGGANSIGCIFSITTGGSSYTDLYDFTASTGGGPLGDLLLSGNVFFGLAEGGGANSDGVVFSVHKDGTQYTDLHDFDGTHGATPYGSVMLSSGILYGMTTAGGSSSDGVIWDYTICNIVASTSVMSNDICHGGSTGSVSASATGAGSPPYTYSWAPGSQTTATITGLTAGTYTVTVTDYYSCSATASATITQPSTLSVSATASTYSICPGSSDVLSASVSGGTSPFTYAWTPYNFGDLTCPTCATTTAYPFGTTYTITVMDNCGATATASVSITIHPLPYVNIAGPINPIAPGRSDTLVASALGATYLWSNSSTTSSIIVSPSVSTTYTVKATSTYGCVDSASYYVDTNSIGVGTGSGNAIRIVPSSGLTKQSFSTYDSVEWFSFVPTDSNNQIIAYSNYLGIPVPHVHRLTLFNSSLNTVVDEPMPDIQGANQIRIDISHLDIGSTYYVRAARTPAHANMPGCNPTGDVCNKSQRWSFQMAFRTVPVFVPQDSGAEPFGVNQLYYESRGQIEDLNKIPRFDIKTYTNFASPAVYASDSAVSFVYAKIHNNRAVVDTIQRVDMELTGTAVEPSQPVFKMQEDSNAGYLNYFLGFAQNGVPKVEGYSRLVYKNVYPNIDMQVYSNSFGTKFYFVCNPAGGGVGGGNPADIELEFKGATSVSVTGGGLQVATEAGTLSFAPGYAYTDSAGIVKPKSWQAYFVSVNSNTVRFNTGAYNTNEPLIIQVDRGHSVPPGTCLENLCWSTYMGGSNGADEINGLYTDVKGNLYTAGQTNSTDFPVTNGVVQDTSLMQLLPPGNATIAKFNLNSDLLWATYYGGSYLTSANSIVADATENVFVTGLTYSFADFPRQQPNIVQYPNAYYQQYCNGDPTFTCPDGDAFIIELNQAGSQKKWATWWGGCDDDVVVGGPPPIGVYSEVGNHLVIDGNKNLYVVGGHTYEIEYAKDPLVTEAGAYNDTVGTGFILKFNIDSSSVNFANLDWATNIGGNNGTANTSATLNSCAVDGSNNLFVTGTTDYGNYPVGYGSTLLTYEGNGDAVITKFDAATNAIDWAEDYGGDYNDYGQAIAISQSGNVYITGYTNSPASTVKIPLHDPSPGNDYYRGTNAAGPVGSGGMNAFVAELNNTTGGIYWSTYFGGIDYMYAYGIAVDADSDIYITGTTANSFPLPSAPVANTYTLSFTGHPDNPFLAEFNSQLQYGWGTCLDGTGSLANDAALTATTDNIHNLLYIAGKTASTGATFPNMQYDGGFIQTTDNEPSGDVTSFISRFNLAPITTGIDNLSIKSGDITVYPNPFTGNITVEMNLTQKENVEFLLYNVMGQIVYTKNLSEQGGMISQEINLSLLAQGVYLLKVNEGNTYFTKKIIKQD